MNVTRENFKEAVAEVEDAISNASFLAIDAEFTGLNQKWDLNTLDTPEERYQKLREGCMDFQVIQFGLCTFHHDSVNEKFSHRAFNFYIFPRSYGRAYPDRRFLCQSSSLEFLVCQGFDFNKLFKEGISYLRQGEEDRLREAMEERHSQQKQEKQGSTPKNHGPEIDLNGVNSTPKTPFVIPPAHRGFVDGIHQLIGMFRSSSEKSLDLPLCSNFNRKLIYESVNESFTGLDLQTIMTDKMERFIRVTKVTEGEVIDRVQSKTEVEKFQLEQAVGFTKVLRFISKSKKLVIGHNMMLDMMHIVNQFFTPLPEDYEDFKVLVRTIFPRILDTKVMSNTKPLKELFLSTALNHLLKATHESPLKPVAAEVVEGKKGYNTDRDQLHEAGYDAYITGLCFLSMANYLGSLQKTKRRRINPDDPLVEAYSNKLHMMLSQDIPYMNLVGQDFMPVRDHVFHVTFPKNWKIQDINQLFSPYGLITISSLDETTAFVALKWPENAPSAKSLLRERNSAYRVMRYADFIQRQRRNSTGSILKERVGQVPVSDPAAPAPKRPRRSSSSSDVTSTSRVCDPIPEEEPSPKKPKVDDPARKKLFDEPDSWDESQI